MKQSICVCVYIGVIGYTVFFTNIYETVFTLALGDAGIGSAWGTILVGGIGPFPGPLTTHLTTGSDCLSVKQSICVCVCVCVRVCDCL